MLRDFTWTEKYELAVSDEHPRSLESTHQIEKTEDAGKHASNKEEWR